MRFHQIQRMAKGLGIRTWRVKKTELIHAIQKTENNLECYGTQRVENCAEQGCLWRTGCIALNNSGRHFPELQELFHSKKNPVRDTSAISRVFLSETSLRFSS